MMEGGYYQQKRLSPTGVAAVAMLHGVALFALMTARGDLQPIKLKDPVLIKIKEPPPPPPETHAKTPPQKHESTIEIVKPVVELLPKPPQLDLKPIVIPPIGDQFAGRGTIVLPPTPPPPVHEPVRIQPRIDPNSALQPPYPASAQREGAEGTVEVRVAIGADGRVKAVERVGGGRDDFFAATERQALRYWRFKPATVDGKPIESSKVMTVHFRLDDLG